MMYIFVQYVLTVREFYRNELAARQTYTQLRALSILLDKYVDANRRWPTSIDELLQFGFDHRTEVEGAFYDEKEYKKALSLVDGWGNRFALKKVSKAKTEVMGIVSGGFNGRTGDSDDMIKWFPVNPEIIDADSNFVLPFLKP